VGECVYRAPARRRDRPDGAANWAVNLAQGCYNLGLASIVELSQSQLNQTQAEIANLSARYDYQSQYQALQYAIGQLR